MEHWIIAVVVLGIWVCGVWFLMKFGQWIKRIDQIQSDMIRRYHEKRRKRKKQPSN